MIDPAKGKPHIPGAGQSKAPTQEIHDCVTLSGIVPEELTFLLGNVLPTWNPYPGVFQGRLDRMASRLDACRAYLRTTDRCFQTLDELEAHVRKHNWPELELLLVAIESWRQRKQMTQSRPDGMRSASEAEN